MIIPICLIDESNFENSDDPKEKELFKKLTDLDKSDEYAQEAMELLLSSGCDFIQEILKSPIAIFLNRYMESFVIRHQYGVASGKFLGSILSRAAYIGSDGKFSEVYSANATSQMVEGKIVESEE